MRKESQMLSIMTITRVRKSPYQDGKLGQYNSVGAYPGSYAVPSRISRYIFGVPRYRVSVFLLP